MKNIADLAQLITSVSFLFYGASSLVTKKMDIEFKRYGLSHLKNLTGLLQIAGGLGLTAGFYLPYLTALSALGLAMLMIAGYLARVRIKDPFVERIPALLFFVINLFILYMNL